MNLDFDTEEYEPNAGGDFELLPEGWLDVIVTGDGEKESTSGNKMCEFILEATDRHKGRKVWLTMNLWHPNETARNIARGDLAAMVRACGMQRIKNTRELVGKRLSVKIKHRKRDDKTFVDVKGYDVHGKGQKEHEKTKPSSRQPASTSANSEEIPF